MLSSPRVPRSPLPAGGAGTSSLLTLPPRGAPFPARTMTRLVIDARLASHSGIGTYLAELLPRVLHRLAAWRPLVLCTHANQSRLETSIGTAAPCAVWNVAPLSVGDLLSTPPGVGPHDLLWTPHFNVPLRSDCALAVSGSRSCSVTASAQSLR